MNVLGSLEDARRHEVKLKNAAWKCYTGLKDHESTYSQHVYYLYKIHAEVANFYDHKIIEWKQKENNRVEAEGISSVTARAEPPKKE